MLGISADDLTAAPSSDARFFGGEAMRRSYLMRSESSDSGNRSLFFRGHRREASMLFALGCAGVSDGFFREYVNGGLMLADLAGQFARDRAAECATAARAASILDEPSSAIVLHTVEGQRAP